MSKHWLVIVRTLSGCYAAGNWRKVPWDYQRPVRLLASGICHSLELSLRRTHDNFGVTQSNANDIVYQSAS